jgi:hypothetical protein
MRDTVLDQENIIGSIADDDVTKSLHHSELSSFANNDGGDGILPLLEGFCKKGDYKSLHQFRELIKSNVQKSLLYRAIEFKQV